MSQTGNNSLNETLDSLQNAAKMAGNFLNELQGKLTPEQKAELDKHLQGEGGFNSKMEKVNKDLTEAMNSIKNFKSQ